MLTRLISETPNYHQVKIRCPTCGENVWTYMLSVKSSRSMEPEKRRLCSHQLPSVKQCDGSHGIAYGA